MIVCLCEGVSDRELQRAVDLGARNLEALESTCGAGGDCGGCHRKLEEILRERACSDCAKGSEGDSRPCVVRDRVDNRETERRVA